MSLGLIVVVVRVLELVNVSVVLGLMYLTLMDSTLVAITVGNFVFLHNVTAPGLLGRSMGYMRRACCDIRWDLYILQSTLFFERPVSAASCGGGEDWRGPHVTLRGVVVVGRSGGSCRYLALIS